MFAAKVSKLLNPVGVGKARPKEPQARAAYDRRRFRGDQLRAVLGVETTSAVLDRKVRNASEHFDERLDEWTAGYPRVTADEMEAGMVQEFPPPPSRVFDDDGWVVEVAGETVDLSMLENELDRILATAMELEPLAGLGDTGLATLLAGLPPFPSELRLDAPTRRPDEDVRTGIDSLGGPAGSAEQWVTHRIGESESPGPRGRDEASDRTC